MRKVRFTFTEPIEVTEKQYRTLIERMFSKNRGAAVFLNAVHAGGRSGLTSMYLNDYEPHTLEEREIVLTEIDNPNLRLLLQDVYGLIDQMIELDWEFVDVIANRLDISTKDKELKRQQLDKKLQEYNRDPSFVQFWDEDVAPLVKQSFEILEQIKSITKQAEKIIW